MADEIISLTTVKLNNMLVPVFEAAEAMAAEYLRYVLRHDQKEFLIVVGDVVVHPPNTTVNCITCLARGPELPEVDDEMCVAETGERNATPLQRS